MNDEQIAAEIENRLKGMEARTQNLSHAVAGMLFVAESHAIEDAIAAISVAITILESDPENVPPPAVRSIALLDQARSTMLDFMVRAIHASVREKHGE